jgi:hypothetical protein
LWRTLVRARRASIAVWLAVMAPGLCMAVAMAVEVGAWAAAQVSVQRAADVSAMAGAMSYQASANKQSAAIFAARMAQLNGGTGTAAPSWNSGTNTLTDNMVTAQVVSGYQTASDTALTVTVKRTIQAGVSKAFSSTPSYTITGMGTAELVTVPGSGAQACLVALSTSGTAITLSGSADIIGNSCAIRSDASIGMSGSATIAAASTYAAGTISTSGSASVTGTEFTNAGTIADPYASYPPVVTALANLHSGSGSAYSLSGSNTGTINPGTYASLTLSGSASVTLNPGLYVVNGDVSVSGSARMIGTGVTIVTSGNVTISGSGITSLTPPGTTPAGSAVSGFVFIGNSSGTWTFSGSDQTILTGVVYAPHASLSYSGSATASPSSCLEFIVNNATLSGSASLSGGCSTFGAPSFGAAASIIQSRLVH